MSRDRSEHGLCVSVSRHPCCGAGGPTRHPTEATHALVPSPFECVSSFPLLRIWQRILSNTPGHIPTRDAAQACFRAGKANLGESSEASPSAPWRSEEGFLSCRHLAYGLVKVSSFRHRRCSLAQEEVGCMVSKLPCTFHYLR